MFRVANKSEFVGVATSDGSYCHKKDFLLMVIVL